MATHLHHREKKEMEENRTEKMLPTPKTEEMPEIAAFEPKSITLPLVLISLCVSFILVVCVFALVKQSNPANPPAKTSTTTSSSDKTAPSKSTKTKQTKRRTVVPRKVAPVLTRAPRRPVVRTTPPRIRQTAKTKSRTAKTLTTTKKIPPVIATNSPPPVQTMPSMSVHVNPNRKASSE